MIISFQTVQDTLYALITVVGIAVVFALALVAVAGLDQRSRTRNTRVGTPAAPKIAQHATQTDDARQLALR
jgi:hypothetical protein